jgi:hypothetical protein
VADVVDTVFAVEEAATGKTSNDTSPLVSIVGAVRNLPLLILWLVVVVVVVLPMDEDEDEDEEESEPGRARVCC